MTSWWREAHGTAFPPPLLHHSADVRSVLKALEPRDRSLFLYIVGLSAEGVLLDSQPLVLLGGWVGAVVILTVAFLIKVLTGRERLLQAEIWVVIMLVPLFIPLFWSGEEFLDG